MLNEIKDVGMEAQLTLSRVDRERLGRPSLGLRSVRAASPDSGQQRSSSAATAVPCRFRIVLIRFRKKDLWPATVLLEAAAMDGRFQAAIDGRLLFEPFDYDDPARSGTRPRAPFDLSVRGGAAEVERDSGLSRHLLHGDLGRRAQASSSWWHSVGSNCVGGGRFFFVLGERGT